MPNIEFLLLFYSGGIAFWVLLSWLMVRDQNSSAKPITAAFVEQSSKFAPLVIKDIELTYWEMHRLGTRIRGDLFNNSRCDLYLFSNFMAIVRQHKTIFGLTFFKPILITSEVAQTRPLFIYLEIFKPYKIYFQKSRITIRIIHSTNGQIKGDITLKNLTEAQLTQLETIKSWC